MAAPRRPALLRRRDLAQAIRIEAERPVGSDPRIELPHRAGRRVARVDVGPLVLQAAGDLVALLLVELLVFLKKFAFVKRSIAFIKYFLCFVKSFMIKS